MTKLSFNDQKIQNQVIQNIEKGITNLENANNITSNIFVPNTFYHTNGLVNCLNEVSSLTSSLKQIKNWLVKVKSDYNKVMNEIDENFSKLSSFDLEERKRMIL